MEPKKISSLFAVSGQITAEDMAEINAKGYRAIICNRPDGEATDQPGFQEIEDAAKSFGIAARYVPIKSGSVTADDIRAFATAVEKLPHPVLAYCRTGNRSATLWSLNEASR